MTAFETAPGAEVSINPEFVNSESAIFNRQSEI